MNSKSKIWQIVLLVLLVLAIIAILLFNNKLNASKESLSSTLAQLTEEQANSAALKEDLDAARADYDDVSGQLKEAQASAEALSAEVESGKATAEQLQGDLTAANDRAAELEASVSERDATIETLEAAAAEKDEAIKSLEAAVAEKDEAVKGLEAAVAEKDEAVKGLEAAAAEKDETVKGLEAAAAEKDEAIKGLEAAVAQKDEAVKGLEAAAAEKDETVKGLEAAAAEKDEAIKGLEAAAAEKDEAIKGFETAIAQKDATIGELQETVAAHAATIDTLNGVISENESKALNEKIAARLAELKAAVAKLPAENGAAAVDVEDIKAQIKVIEEIEPEKMSAVERLAALENIQAQLDAALPPDAHGKEEAGQGGQDIAAAPETVEGAPAGEDKVEEQPEAKPGEEQPEVKPGEEQPEAKPGEEQPEAKPEDEAKLADLTERLESAVARLKELQAEADAPEAVAAVDVDAVKQSIEQVTESATDDMSVPERVEALKAIEADITESVPEVMEAVDAQALDQVQARLETSMGQIESLQGFQGTVPESVADVDLDALRAQIADILSDEVSSAAERVESLRKLEQELEETLSEELIAGLEELSAMQDKLDATQAEVDQLSSELDEKRGTIDDLNAQIAALGEQAETDASKLEALQGELAEAQAEADAKSAALTEAQAEADAKNEELEAAKAEFAERVEELEAYKLDRDITSGEAHISTAVENAIEVAEDGVTATWQYANSNLSGNAAILTLTLDGETIYTSEALKPGETIDTLTLDKPLASGEYQAMAVTTVYDDAGEAQLTSRVPVTINVR